MSKMQWIIVGLALVAVGAWLFLRKQTPGSTSMFSFLVGPTRTAAAVSNAATAGVKPPAPKTSPTFTAAAEAAGLAAGTKLVDNWLDSIDWEN